MMEQVNRALSFGWIPDLPDFRDYTEMSASIQEIMLPTGLAPAPNALISGGNKKNAAARGGAKQLGTKQLGTHTATVCVPSIPSLADLRKWCSPVEDQGHLAGRRLVHPKRDGVVLAVDQIIVDQQFPPRADPNRLARLRRGGQGPRRRQKQQEPSKTTRT